MVTENFESSTSNSDFNDEKIGDYNYDENIDASYNLSGTDLREEARLHKCKVKSDFLVIGASVITNGIPILVDNINRKRQGLPPTVQKDRLVKFGVNSAVPLLMLVDDVFLKGKIQKKIPLSDVRNVVNIVSAYPNTHKVINATIDNNFRKSTGRAKIDVDKARNVELVLDLTNIVTPYIASKMTDDSLNFVEKVKSAVPVPIVGFMVKKICNLNPNLRRAYDNGSTLVRIASGATKSLGSAMRSNPNSTVGKATSTLGDILDTVSDLTGVNRGGGFGGGNYYGGGRSSWSGF